jgi:hypothetical protein
MIVMLGVGTGFVCISISAYHKHMILRGCIFIVMLTVLIWPSQAFALVHTITYTEEGFVPAQIMAKVRDTVKIVNDTEEVLQLFNSEYTADDTDFRFNVGSIQPVTYQTLLLTNPGTFVFHNRLQRAHAGNVTVMEKMDLIAYYRERGDNQAAEAVSGDEVEGQEENLSFVAVRGRGGRESG